VAEPVVIIGGGLAGLSAARVLREAGEDFLLLEAEERVGGLCRTESFGAWSFDYTGHLLHLRPGKVRGFLLSLLGPDVSEHARRASVLVGEDFVPFPLQAHFGALGEEKARALLAGWRRAVPLAEGERPSFLRWAESQFGRGMVDIFFSPYNRKLFVHPLAELLATWTAWSVPRPTAAQMERAARPGGNAAATFGYNPSFFYPRAGGIELLPQRIARGSEPFIRTGARVVEVDARKRTVSLWSRGGEKPERMGYRRLISTAALPELLRMTAGIPVALAAAAARLRHSSVLCLCLGARGFAGRDEHWMYFPGEGLPFYRAGLPGNFSRRVGPAGGVSFYVEAAFDPRRAPDRRALARAMRKGMGAARLLPPQAAVEAEGTLLLPHGYVFYDRFREDNLPRILAALREAGIDSVGRYGAWEYASMQDAVEQGMAAARRALA
jgi:protoporphyrinogen oxidase